MYRAPPSAEEAAAFGLTLDEASGPPIEVWPDTQRPILVFDALGTQWLRAGMTGVPTGLIYASLEPVLRVMAVPAEDWQEVFADVRVLEEAALTEMHRQAKK